MTRINCAILLTVLLFSCSDSEKISNANKEDIKTEVSDMFKQYHTAIAKDGLVGEFAYLDNSEDFYWVPPGYVTALNYDSVKAILEVNAKGFQAINFHWETLSIFPLSKSIASYSGIVKGVMTDTSGVETPVSIIESGTVIRRDDGWKLLNGQSAELYSASDAESIPRVTGVGGIFFKSKNPKEMKEWYYKNLGLVRNDYGSMFEFREGSDPSHVAYLQWSPFSDKTTYFEPSEKSFMINYRVANMEELVDKLKANGVTVVDQIETYEYGKFVHILDLENNKIELWEPIDIVYTNLYAGKTTK